MKKKNTPTQTRSTPASPDGLVGNDTNKPVTYEVNLVFTGHARASLLIEAHTLAEAETKARRFQSDDVEYWYPLDGKVHVQSLKPIAGGQNHE